VLVLFTKSRDTYAKKSGARFSKFPTVFRRISGDIILFVSSKRNGVETRNSALSLNFIPSTR